MDRIVYTAMGGAARTLEHQAVLTNNMANANTPGFRAQLAMYRSVPVVDPVSPPTRVSTVTATPGNDFSQGAVNTTDRALDVAVAGAGWLVVQTPQGEAYTRAGGLQIGTDGLLRGPQGLPVLSADNAPIAVPEQARLTFATDGTITALGPGDPPSDIQLLGQLKLVNPPTEQLVHGDDGLFRRLAADGQPAGPLPADPTVHIVPGAIEGSNVNPVEAMVGMIDNARRFEMQMKVIKNADENAQRANSILSVST